MQDNCATFDKLIPLLETNNSILALDLPGHGFSSHLPPGLVLHYLDNVIYIRYLLKNHFNFNNLIFLGHSYGSSLLFVYAALYPDEVKKFIDIENAMYNLYSKTDKYVKDIRETMDGQLQIEDGYIDKTYDLDDLINFMYESRKVNYEVSLEGCKTLLTRGAIKNDDGKYFFSRDPRLRFKLLGRIIPDFVIALSKRIQCDYINIRATDGIPKGDRLKVCLQVLENIKKSASTFKEDIVEGTHHVHLDNPEKVAPIINNFLRN